MQQVMKEELEEEETIIISPAFDRKYKQQSNRNIFERRRSCFQVPFSNNDTINKKNDIKESVKEEEEERPRRHSVIHIRNLIIPNNHNNRGSDNIIQQHNSKLVSPAPQPIEEEDNNEVSVKKEELFISSVNNNSKEVSAIKEEENLQKKLQQNLKEKLKEKFKNLNWKEISINLTFTLTYFLIHFLIGCANSITGLTLTNIAKNVSTSTSEMGWIFFCKGMGVVIGNIVGGKIFDFIFEKINFFKLRNFLLHFEITFFITLACVCLIIIPFIPIFGVLLFIYILFGISVGVENICVNLLCLKIWKQNASPVLVILASTAGLGSFLFPIIVNALLNIGLNWKYTFIIIGIALAFVGCVVLLFIQFILRNVELLSDNNNITKSENVVKEECNVEKSESENNIDLGETNVISEEEEITITPTQSVTTPISPIDNELSSEQALLSPTTTTTTTLTTNNNTIINNNTVNNNHQQKEEQLLTSITFKEKLFKLYTKTKSLIVSLLIGITMFGAVGVENCFGGLFITFIQEKKITNLSECSLMISIFFLTMTLGRYISAIFLSFINLPQFILSISLLGSLTSAFIFLFCISSSGTTIIIWISVILMGFSLATIYPTSLAYPSSLEIKYVKISGMLQSLIFMIALVVKQLFHF
ncbi:hypothetical protein ABK040_013965 [Willaertia magna]